MRGLTARLLIFNLLLAVFPVGAILFLGTYEEQLLDSQERAMVQQGRLLASAVAGENLAADARAVLKRLGDRNDARLRVVDKNGYLLADSAISEDQNGKLLEINSRNQEAVEDEDTTETSYPEESVIYQIGALPARIFRQVVGYMRPPQVPRVETDFYIGRAVLDDPEIKAALDGRYGAATRISEGQISVTLYSAIPIIWEDEVIGAVQVSRSTFVILNNLYRLRLDIMNIFLFGVGGAVILSILLARTVTVPVGRLRDQAERLLDDRGKLLAKFNPLSGKDEVADLSRALYKLSSRLQERTSHLEDFIADLVHETKNPVAGILSAAELADHSTTGESKRFLTVINREARRIQHLLDDLRELISVDVRLDEGNHAPLNLNELVKTLIEAYSQREENDVFIECINMSENPVYINANPDRLTQAILNLVDNAVSYSPADGVVEVRIEGNDKRVSLSVSDEGPGIPEHELQKIFKRWYTDRPEENAANHTGLGLAIVQGIATGYGGRVFARNSPSGGAVFTMEFPGNPT